LKSKCANAVSLSNIYITALLSGTTLLYCFPGDGTPIRNSLAGPW
jgi:hypothetical protein